jgi:2-dehydro-3-deoxygluconokinase
MQASPGLHPNGTEAFDLVSVGETMLMFVPDPPQPLDGRVRYRPTVAGAESNVAAFAAALGVRSAWVSRVGDDQFGRHVLQELTGRGVDVCRVERDPRRPTGVAFKELSSDGTRVRYFRRGSAASAMGEGAEQVVRSLHTRLVHVTGITAALSDSCQALVQRLMTDRPAGRTVSFDVNWRPALWTDRDSAVLLTVARASDVVFVGLDEAQALWGVTDVRAVRRMLPEPRVLVVKQGAEGATAFHGDEEVFVPSLEVDVVEPVGAGDALAAGFLVGLLRQLSVKQALRLGTIVAGSALRVTADVGPLPSRTQIEPLLEASDRAWRNATLEPVGTERED